MSGAHKRLFVVIMGSW